MNREFLRRNDGFTLAELAIVLVIIALLVGGMLVPLSAQRDIQNTSETQKQLAKIEEALLGFAAANGRLPCPASATSNGVESYCTNPTGPCGDIIVPPIPPRPNHGRCSHPYTGILPGVTLGLPGIDANGSLTDAWGLSSNGIRYAVYSSLGTASGQIGGVDHPFTATDGIKTATMANISGRSPLLSVCKTATDIANPGFATAQCTSTTATLTNSAVAVIFSLGKNAAIGGAGADEAVNLDDDPAFVSHMPTGTGAAGGEFDDLVTWISPNVLFNRMIAAGRLP